MDAEYLNLQLESVDGLLASLPPNSCVKTLNLHFNLLKDLKGLKNMNNYVKNIVEINISSNRLSNSSNLNDLTYLFDLKVLDLSGNYYTSLDELPYLPSLQALHVAYNPIKTLENIHRNCPNITKLDIRNICLPSYYDENTFIKPLNELKSLRALLVSSSTSNMVKSNLNMTNIILNIIAKCKHIQSIDDIPCIEWTEKHKPIELPSTSPVPILPPRSPTMIDCEEQIINDDKENITINEISVVAVNTPRFDQIAQRFRNKHSHKELNSSMLYSRFNDHSDYAVELDETVMMSDNDSDKDIENGDVSYYGIDNDGCNYSNDTNDDGDESNGNDDRSEHDTEDDATATYKHITLVNTGAQTISVDPSASFAESVQGSNTPVREYIDEATSPFILSVNHDEKDDSSSSLLVSIDNNSCVSAPANQQATDDEHIVSPTSLTHSLTQSPTPVVIPEIVNQTTQTTDSEESNHAQQAVFHRQLKLQKLLVQRHSMEKKAMSDALHSLKWNSIIHQVSANHKRSQEMMQSKFLQERREAVDSVSRRLINQEGLNMTLRRDIDKLSSKYDSVINTNTYLEAQAAGQMETIRGLEQRLQDEMASNAAINAQLSTANTNVIMLNKLCNDTMQENSHLQNELEEVKNNYHKLEKRFHTTETCFNEATEQLTISNYNNKMIMSKFQELTECTKRLQITLRHYKQLYEAAVVDVNAVNAANVAREIQQNAAIDTDGIVDTSEISKRLDSLEIVLVQKTKELIDSQHREKDLKQKEKDLNLVIKVKEKMLEDQVSVIASLKEKSTDKNNEIEQLLQTINQLQEAVDALNEDINSYEVEISSKNKIIKELRALVHALQQSNQVTTSMSIDDWSLANISEGVGNDDDDEDGIEDDSGDQ